MSQVDTYTVPTSLTRMAQVQPRLEELFAAAASCNRGASAPANPFEGMFWWDMSGGDVEVLKRYTVVGGWAELLSVNIITGVATLVTASSTFGSDNRLLRSDGTGRGAQASGITVDDSNNATLPGTLTMSGKAINEAHGADIASASTINLATATGNLVDVTGTTAITAITLAEGAEREVRFTGALTLTHGASLVLPSGGANITTAAGDFATFRGYADGVVRCTKYTRVDGAAISGAMHGQCRLTKSGSNLLLSPYNGNKLIINGATQSVPSAGISLAPTSLSVGTIYYIYAYMNSGTMTLEASATGHATDSNTGVEIKSGDSTRTLVGLARIVSGPAWADGVGQRLVISWFNRRKLALYAAIGSQSTTSTTDADLSSSARLEFMSWGGAVSGMAGGYASGNNPGQNVVARLYVDGAAASVDMIHTVTNSGYGFSTATNYAATVTEGYHYQSIYGRVTGATTGIFVMDHSVETWG